MRSASPSPAFLLQLTTVVLISLVDKVTAGLGWCQYFNMLGIERLECSAPSLPPPETTAIDLGFSARDLDIHFPTDNYPEHQWCRGSYGMCHRSTECESSTMCRHTYSGFRCCTSPNSQCPTVDTMGITCTKALPVNWCMSDYDCKTHRTSTQMCCPTGCNYNICTQPFSSISSLTFMALMMSPDCPYPYSLRMRCIKHRPVSWCAGQSDCPSMNALMPRRCCRTPCGYNACMIKYGGRWLIG